MKKAAITGANGVIGSVLRNGLSKCKNGWKGPRLLSPGRVPAPDSPYGARSVIIPIRLGLTGGWFKVGEFNEI